MGSILYTDQIKINDAISIHIPTVGEVFDHEDDYFSAITTIISTPYDMMVQLDDVGIDFTQINKFELFCLMFQRLQETDTGLLFGDLDLSLFKNAINERTKERVLYDEEHDIVIDRVVHEQMSQACKRILQITKPEKKPGNEEGRLYMIRIARMNLRKQQRLARNRTTSQLEDLIISMVNTAEFPYNYETVRDISIYQFYMSLNQVAHKINYDNVMHGYYAGAVKFEDLKKEDRTWLRL